MQPPVPTCILCERAIAPGDAVVELAGGFFAPSEPDLFVQDEDVLPVVYVHRAGLLARLVRSETAPGVDCPIK